MALSQFAAGATLAAADLNAIIDMLQGASGSTDAFLFRSSTGNDFIIRLSDAAGARQVTIQDSAGVEVAAIDSDGNLSISGTFTPTTQLLPTAAAPSQTAEGSAVWDSDDDRLTVGTGAATKVIGLSRGAGSDASATQELMYDTTAAALKVWDGSASVAIRDFIWIEKAATETLQNDTFQNDDDFTFTAAASTDYLVEMALMISTGTTPDWKFTWVLTGMTWGGQWNADVKSATANITNNFNNSLASAASQGVVATAAAVGSLWRATFVIHGGTGGTLNFQWAQSTTDASNTSVLKNSVMRYRSLGAT